MADLEPPSDLLELKRAFLQLDARCEEISAALPSNVLVLAGQAEPDMEGQAELMEARSDRLRVVEEINAHPWWSGVDDRHAAWMALLKAAKA
ncbi:hypothetical protein [Nonomuraea dietziae]|uniref:hypothetical protein n=1 Tax=Nonomuraea dietziae TaxID=65515 RepID=UPI00342934C1